MPRYALLILFTLLCACIAIYAIWTINVSKRKQDNLLSEFNRIDRSLKNSNDSLRRRAPIPEIEISAAAAAIVAGIDSMKHDIAMAANRKEGNAFTFPDKNKLLVLKQRLLNFNTLVREKFPCKAGINAGDFINLDDVRTGNKSTAWEVYYFENSNSFAAITELTYMSVQVQKLKQKILR